jgi:hypothetical protein
MSNEKPVNCVYRYGLLRPVEMEATVRQQMRAAHHHANTLTEIERGRRAAVREALEADPAFSAALGAWRAAVTASEAAYRDHAITEDLTSVRAAEREARDAFFESLTTTQAVVRDRIDVIKEYALELGRSARKYCRVWWGSYLLTEKAANASSRDLPLYDDGQPNDPRFKRWTGDGRVGLHVQGGVLTTNQVHAPNLDVYFEERPAPAGCDPDSARSQRRKYVNLVLRVGTRGRDPIWAKFPMVMHRPLPDGKVTWVYVVLRHIGPIEEWYACITVNTDRASAQPESCGTGDVAIDIGWRAKDDGSVRVAIWKDRHGNTGEVVVPASIRDEFSQCDALRGRREDNFNMARVDLSIALDTLAVPAWLTEATRTLSHWRSHDRLLELAKAWRTQRFDGDLEAFSQVWAWRKQELHLWSWEASQRTKAKRHITDIYDTTAAKLARTYGRLVLEDFDMTDVARRPERATDESFRQTAARANRQAVGVSIFRLAVTHAFRSRGGVVGKHNPAYTTQTCHACRHVAPVGLGIDHTCPACGATRDQDVNAAENLLDLAAAPKPARRAGKVKDPTESRWVRVRAAKVARRTRMAIARREAIAPGDGTKATIEAPG